MIEEQQLSDIVAYLKVNGLTDQAADGLRGRYKKTHFSFCFEDDINVGKPVVEEDTFAIYLVDSREHCSKLTNDLSIASGYVIAERFPE